jgi:hypothetical protein
MIKMKWPKRLYLCQAHIWAYWLPVKPGFRLYELIGYDDMSGIYSFRAKNHNGGWFQLTYNDLMRYGGGGAFKPFLVNPGIGPELQEL